MRKSVSPLSEAEKAGAEAEAESLHPDIRKTLRCPVVPQLVDQNHDPDQDQRPPDILKD